MRLFFLCAMIWASGVVQAQQVGVHTPIPHPSAAMDIESTKGGLLIPRMTSDQRMSVINPAIGLLVFDTKTESFWLYASSGWTELANAAQSATMYSRNGSVQFDTLFTDRKRYIWELNGSFAFGNSITLPNSIVLPLCADLDGCKVTLTMTNWEPSATASTSVSGMFYLGPTVGGMRTWRLERQAGNISMGMDGNNSVQTIMSLFDTAFFTDAAYTNSAGSDAVQGLHFMKWPGGGYPASTIIRLIMED